MDKKLLKKTIIKLLLDEVDGLKAIYIFGSWADNTMKTDSDVDIAILCATKMNTLDLWKIQEKMAGKISRDVDLLDFRRSSEIMKVQVIEKGDRIYMADENMVEEYETRAVWLYIDLMELTAPIYRDIHDSGKVYG